MYNPQGHMSDVANKVLAENPDAQLIVHTVTYTEAGIVADNVSITMAASLTATDVSFHESYLSPEMLSPKVPEVRAADLEAVISEYFSLENDIDSSYALPPRIATFDSFDESTSFTNSEIFNADKLAEFLNPKLEILGIPDLQLDHADLKQASFADTIFTDSSYDNLISIIDNLKKSDLVLVPNAEKAAFIADLMDILGIQIKRIIIPADIEIPPALQQKAIVIGKSVATTLAENLNFETSQNPFKVELESALNPVANVTNKTSDQFIVNSNTLSEPLSYNSFTRIPEISDIPVDNLIAEYLDINIVTPQSRTTINQPVLADDIFADLLIPEIFVTQTKNVLVENQLPQNYNQESKISLQEVPFEQESFSLADFLFNDQKHVTNPLHESRQLNIPSESFILNESIIENVIPQSKLVTKFPANTGQNKSGSEIPVRNTIKDIARNIFTPVEDISAPVEAAFGDKKPKANKKTLNDLNKNSSKLAQFLKELKLPKDSNLLSKASTA